MTRLVPSHWQGTTLFALWFLLLAVLPTAAPAIADGTVENCSDDAALSTVLIGGGNVTFDCGGLGETATIVLSGTKTISTDTTIDGGGKITLSGNDAFRLFVVNSGASLDLRNIVLEKGHAASDGGAVSNAGFLALDSATIESSTTSTSGGAIATTGAVDITNSTLADNSAEDGGALFAVTASAQVSIDSTVVTGNKATVNGSAGGNGGGLEASGGAALHVHPSSVDMNTADHQGGGIYVDGSSSLDVQGTSLRGNSAGSSGGAIYNAGTATVNDTTIEKNKQLAGSQSGSGIENAAGTLTVTNSTLAKNTGAGGGAIGTDFAGSSTLTNVTISGNTGGQFTDGGGLAIFQSSATLTNVTFSDNSAGGGGAIWLDGSPTSHLSLTNVLVTRSGGGNCVLGKALDKNVGNLESDGTCAFGGGRDNVQIRLGPLETNGGPTETRRLLVASAAIDAGTDAGCPATDQRGVSRIQGAACDVGAVEFEPCASAPTEPVLAAPAQGSKVSALGVLLNWTGPDCARKFSLEMREGSKTGPLVLSKNGIKATQFETDPFPNTRTRFWRVTACNGNGCSTGPWWKFKIAKVG